MAGGRIDLAWTAATDNVGVAGYNIYRDGTKINAAPVGSISYSDTGLGAGANHTYAISAVDAGANESTRSATWSGAGGSGAVTSTYTYDAENRLTGLQSDSNVIGTYAYDGAGNRYAKTAGGVTTAYTLDLASSLPQVLSETAGSAVTSYAYAGGPLELDKSGSTYWYLSDTLGSVRLVTDSTGATPATYAYAAFGSTRASTGTLANEVRFSGERTDSESGLEFLRARTYDPSTGTFLQRDSWGISPTDSQSLDAYAYTANNPINAVDPSGHCWGICIDINPVAFVQSAAGTVTSAASAAVDTVAHIDPSAAAHIALGAATFVPGVGAFAAVADAGLYAYEGDPLSAGLSLAGAIPGGAILKYGAKTLRAGADAEKAVNLVRTVDKAESTVNDLNKVAEAVHANSAASTRLTRLYHLTDAKSGGTLKFGITSAEKMTSRYSEGFLEGKGMKEIASGTRREMLDLERQMVTLGGGPLNREPWSRYRTGMFRD